jgi:hypothetical protein
MRLVVAFLCAAIAFPAMLFERTLPLGPTPERVAYDGSRSLFHHYKNIWTESLRADEQWWGKLLAFAVVVLAVSHVAA